MGMSDEDFLNAPLDAFDLEAPEGASEEETEEVEQDTANDVESTTEAVEDELEDETEETETTDEPEEEESTEVEEESDDDQSEEEPDSDEVDYKALHEELLKPFKVSGSEVSVENVDQARRLMSQGADYANKMAALKPHRKFLKMLEKNELLDESKLSYLIDLSKNNPEAISKLVKDSGIDAMDLDTEEDSKYTPSDYTVGDNEVELDDMISRIQDTPSFSDTMSAIAKLDETSKRTLAKTPAVLEVLNDHMSNGIYAMVTARMAKERMFGGLNGLSDLEAYQRAGEMLNREGAFSKPAQKKEVSTAPKKDTEANKRKDMRRKASPSKASKPSPKEEYNVLSMSDEEFEAKFG